MEREGTRPSSQMSCLLNIILAIIPSFRMMESVTGMDLFISPGEQRRGRLQ
jgi:hypothetical protein